MDDRRSFPEPHVYEHGLLDIGQGKRICREARGAQKEFDPDVFRIVLFDQRGCGDREPLRHHLDIENWLLFGVTMTRSQEIDRLYRQLMDAARLAFVRICSHYFAHRAWLDDAQLLRNARLKGSSEVLIHGRLDMYTPLLDAWVLCRAWPDAEKSPGTPVHDSAHRRRWSRPFRYR